VKRWRREFVTDSRDTVVTTSLSRGRASVDGLGGYPLRSTRTSPRTPARSWRFEQPKLRVASWTGSASEYPIAVFGDVLLTLHCAAENNAERVVFNSSTCSTWNNTLSERPAQIQAEGRGAGDSPVEDRRIVPAPGIGAGVYRGDIQVSYWFTWKIGLVLATRLFVPGSCVPALEQLRLGGLTVTTYRPSKSLNIGVAGDSRVVQNNVTARLLMVTQGAAYISSPQFVRNTVSSRRLTHQPDA
jgi:hypothetical protein